MSKTHADDFDPYHKWLGIPKNKRPPTHYDLLAISIDEEDVDVIRMAANQRRQFVESRRGSGQDAAVAGIIYQIDEAELTLLDPQMRRDYDRRMHLFEKRQRQRRIDPIGLPPRIQSQPGRSVGEGSDVVRTSISIMIVLLIGFGIMAWFSFHLPWRKLDKPIEVVGSREPEAPDDREQPPKADGPSITPAVAIDAAPADVISPEMDIDAPNPNTNRSPLDESQDIPDARRSANHNAPVTWATFSPDGGRIATAGEDGKVRIWNTGTLDQEIVLTGHAGAVVGCFFVDDNRLLSASADKTTRLWDVDSGAVLTTVTFEKPISSLSRILANDRYFVGFADGGVQGASCSMGLRSPVPIRLPKWPVTCLVSDPERKHLLITSREGTIVVWDLQHSVEITRFKPPVAARTLAFSPAGDKVAVGGGDGSTFLYAWPNWTLLGQTRRDVYAITSITYFPDGQYFVTGGMNWSLIVWDAEAGAKIKTRWPGEGHITAVEFSPDGESFLLAFGTSVHIWPTSSIRPAAEAISSISGPTPPASDVDNSPVPASQRKTIHCFVLDKLGKQRLQWISVDAAEAKNFDADPNWTSRGIIGYGLVDGDAETTPLWRYHDRRTAQRRYLLDRQPNRSQRDPGLLAWVWKEQKPGMIQVFVLQNGSGAMQLVSDKEHREVLLRHHGWRQRFEFWLYPASNQAVGE